MNKAERVRGKKVTRTVTAPMVMIQTVGTQKSAPRNLLSRSLTNRLRGEEQSRSLVSLNRSYRPVSSVFAESPLSFSKKEEYSKYSLKQTLKETMNCISKPGEIKDIKRTNCREITRCWSRERVIKTKIILSISRPSSCEPSQNLLDGFCNSSIRTVSSSSLGHESVDVLSPSMYNSEHSLFTIPLSVGRIIPIKTSTTPIKEQSSTDSSPIDEYATGGSIKDDNSEDDLYRWGLPDNYHDIRSGVKSPESNEALKESIDPKLEEVVKEIDEPFDANCSVEYKSGSVSPHYGACALTKHLSEESKVSEMDSEQSDLEELEEYAPVDVNNTEEELPQDPNFDYFRAVVTRDSTGYGFRVCGNDPVSVHGVREDGNAEKAGIQTGDAIIKVNGHSAATMNHDEVVACIKANRTVRFVLRRQKTEVKAAEEKPLQRKSTRHLAMKKSSVKSIKRKQTFESKVTLTDSNANGEPVFTIPIQHFVRRLYIQF